MTRSVVTALALIALSAIPSQAASISFELNCLLPTSGAAQCGGVPSYGTVTFSESLNGDLLLTVDLAIGEKFKDMYFNYNGSAAKITAGSGNTNLLNPGAGHLPPYSGLFDVGPLGGSALFSTTFSGWDSAGNNVDLSLENFQVKDNDGFGQTFLAVHIQGIGPDGDSIKVGSDLLGGSDRDTQTPVPEPASLVLLGSGLFAAAAKIRRRRLQ